MGRYLKATVIVFILAIATVILFFLFSPSTIRQAIKRPEIGEIIDSLDGIYVYYNGSISNTSGRNTSPSGYNLGQKYQCVEFIKRYYYYHYNHQMPDAWGNAVDFFDTSLADGALNSKRGLHQFVHPSASKPQRGDILIYSGFAGNSFGHVSIVSQVGNNFIEVIQQNPGPFSKSRVRFGLTSESGKWHISNDRILGWLRR